MGVIRKFERFDLQIGLWVASAIILALLSTFFCDTISVFAQGSGIPEVKTILSGINFYKYLSFNTLIAKVLGLCTIQSAGFLIGFQGPIIHCSTIIANNMMRLKYFREFYDVPLHLTEEQLHEAATAEYGCGLRRRIHFWNAVRGHSVQRRAVRFGLLDIESLQGLRLRDRFLPGLPTVPPVRRLL